jgi:hypothetical protein
MGRKAPKTIIGAEAMAALDAAGYQVVRKLDTEGPTHVLDKRLLVPDYTYKNGTMWQYCIATPASNRGWAAYRQYWADIGFPRKSDNPAIVAGCEGDLADSMTKAIIEWMADRLLTDGGSS